MFDITLINLPIQIPTSHKVSIFLKMSNYSLKRTSLSPHGAASASVIRFHLTRAANDISPCRDKTSDEQNCNCPQCVPLSPRRLLQHEDLLCLSDSHGGCLVWLAHNGCSGDIFGAVGNRSHQLEDPEGPHEEKEIKYIHRHRDFWYHSSLLSDTISLLLPPKSWIYF